MGPCRNRDSKKKRNAPESALAQQLLLELEINHSSSVMAHLSQHESQACRQAFAEYDRTGISLCTTELLQGSVTLKLTLPAICRCGYRQYR